MYKYDDLKAELFTDEGQRMFLKVRDCVSEILKSAGAITMFAAMKAAGSGDSWTMMACVDRLVELGEIREIPTTNSRGQDRVFISHRQNG